MILELHNGKWKFNRETFFELPEIRRKEFAMLLKCELILAEHNIQPPKDSNMITNIFLYSMGFASGILVAMAYLRSLIKK